MISAFAEMIQELVQRRIQDNWETKVLIQRPWGHGSEPYQGRSVDKIGLNREREGSEACNLL